MSATPKLSVNEQGQWKLTGVYDPPGSAIMAIFTSILSGMIVNTFGLNPGFIATPGWLVWYLIFILCRRVRVDLDVADADNIVIDRSTTRIALHLLESGDRKWFALGFHSWGPEAVEQIARSFPAKTTQGSITSPSPWPTISLLALIGGLLGFIVWYSQRMR